MPRFFTATFSNINIAASAALVVGYVKAATAKPIHIVKAEVSIQGKSDETKVPMKVRLVRLTADGVSGATVTPTLMDPDDGAIGATAFSATTASPGAWGTPPTVLAAASQGVLAEWFISPLSQNQDFFPSGWEPKAVGGGRIGVEITNSDSVTARNTTVVLWCKEE